MGNLCLGGQIERYVKPFLYVFDAAGVSQATAPVANCGSLDPDFAGWPCISTPLFAFPGSTENYQTWHRDVGTSRFSAAISITFQ